MIPYNGFYAWAADIQRDLDTIRNRITYLEANPVLVRTTGYWANERYSECTHLGLLKSELEMLEGVVRSVLSQFKEI